jgi:hypothetical protein
LGAQPIEQLGDGSGAGVEGVRLSVMSSHATSGRKESR